MLSRIAESLYWVGRYTERAEDTARILDVHYHLLLEDRWVDEAAACGALLEVMGVAVQTVPAAATPTPSLASSRSTGTTPAPSWARCPPHGATPAAPGRRSRRRCGSA